MRWETPFWSQKCPEMSELERAYLSSDFMVEELEIQSRSVIISDTAGEESWPRASGSSL